PFFNEFVTTCPVPGAQIESALAEAGILAGLPLEEGILWCVTEMNSKEQIDRLVQLLAEVA
ncbi:MAG: hypothetical protein RR775_23110, partial [Massilia sp.]|uniref:hypothetical protein n=1 Tax=Massilia sp. TaxID=1882437 RepID=UPI002FC8C8C6